MEIRSLDKTLAYSNLTSLLESNPDNGPLWSDACEDLNCTFVAWNPQQGVASHVNSEVDVVITVIAGDGELTVNGRSFSLSPGFTAVIPKGAERSIIAGEERLAYLNVHKKRRLQLTEASARPR